MPVITNTPWELKRYPGGKIWVKREDLCSPAPGPAFSKIRGVQAALRNRLNHPIPPEHIAVLDSIHSKAGWGVSWLAREYGIPVTVYYPTLVSEAPGHVRPFQRKCAEFGATIVPLKATKSAVMWYQARKLFGAAAPGGWLLPNGLKLSESIDETAIELTTYTPPELGQEGTWVVSVSSGTIAAGVAKGLTQIGFRGKLILHLGYSRSIPEVLAYVGQYAFGYKMEAVDEGYGYADLVNCAHDFPCNPWYDLKAWKWIQESEQRFPKPVCFWNIGA